LDRKKDSPIKSYSDFKGKVIGVGPAGSATLNIWSKQHLEAGWGITFDDIKPKYLAFHEISTGIRDNTIDAGLIAAGYPIAAVMELARDIPIRLLEVEPDVLKKLQAKYPNVTPLVFRLEPIKVLIRMFIPMRFPRCGSAGLICLKNLFII